MAVIPTRILVELLRDWRDPDAGPAYSQLADRIRLLVLDGRVGIGDRLPAERDLAGQLGLSRTTVTAAYAELRDRGFLKSVRGSGSVARLPLKPVLVPDAPISGAPDLSKATLPASVHLPAAIERAAARMPEHLHLSGFDPLGLPELRAALARRYTARGLATDPEQIMITVGAQHAIALLARTLLSRGDRALVENPSYPHGFEALRSAGARIVPVAVTSYEGWDVAGLEQALQRTSPALGYLMPDFHNPTGRTMDDETRSRLLALAARQGTTIIADETMGELGFGDQPVRAPLAAHGPAVIVGSVGKTVWGGLRLGWIRADRALIQRLARVRSAGDLGTPVFEQLVVADILGDYDTVLDERRAQLRAGHDHLVAALRSRFPDWDVPAVDGGLTVWVNLGAAVSSQLALAARNEGLLIAAGPRFGVDGAFERFLRIPFSHPAAETDIAVGALERAWATVMRQPYPVESDYLAEVV
ncbi:DNA-binding transcriptional MocR family regulator [Diaminobutyricimonas aerilata]|uniref:DNA-binding transcriptional MocR family regulator n=1 Tax=Diaminobutyricimonas aerilata TaxID=1162967 RepID=A0A2M9CNI0_9MICO|nr:PLP-dependent aminotransferase family protein [Diaminobutyricimonas aerilata]PJJ73450.1 DNA-binding transcriptional MocR family regulator [Diaminobutyricimonas aerilata]